MLQDKSIIAIPPGYTLQEQLDLLDISEHELSNRLNLTPNEVTQLLKGEYVLNKDIAHKLELITQVPESFWLNLESIYRDKLLRIIK